MWILVRYTRIRYLIVLTRCWGEWLLDELHQDLESEVGEGAALEDELLLADVGLDPAFDDQHEEVDRFAFLLRIKNLLQERTWTQTSDHQVHL